MHRNVPPGQLNWTNGQHSFTIKISTPLSLGFCLTTGSPNVFMEWNSSDIAVRDFYRTDDYRCLTNDTEVNKIKIRLTT